MDWKVPGKTTSGCRSLQTLFQRVIILEGTHQDSKVVSNASQYELSSKSSAKLQPLFKLCRLAVKSQANYLPQTFTVSSYNYHFHESRINHAKPRVKFDTISDVQLYSICSLIIILKLPSHIPSMYVNRLVQIETNRAVKNAKQ